MIRKLSLIMVAVLLSVGAWGQELSANFFVDSTLTGSYGLKSTEVAVSSEWDLGFNIDAAMNDVDWSASITQSVVDGSVDNTTIGVGAETGLDVWMETDEDGFTTSTFYKWSLSADARFVVSPFDSETGRWSNIHCNR